MAKEEKKSVFDVSKPGSTPPDSSAKPIIVSHKPMIKDPMMSEGNDKAAKNEPEETVQDMPDEKPAEKHVSKRVEPISESPETQTSDDNPVKEETKSAETTDTVSDDAAIVDTVVSKASDKNKKTKDAQDEAARKENIQKLIETKKYFVKVKAPKAKRNKRAVLVVLFVLLLGLFGIAVAADAELLPIKVPFDFIKERGVGVEDGDSQQNQPANSSSNQTTDVPESKTASNAGSALSFYTLEVPGEWTKEQVVISKDSKVPTGKDVYTLPSGRKLIVNYDLGGRGGMCEPDADDVPHASGNKCSTFEILNAEKIDISETSSNLLYGPPGKAWLLETKFTDITGKTSYSLNIETEIETKDNTAADGDTIEASTYTHVDPVLNEPLMGAFFKTTQVMSQEYYFRIDIEGVEDISESFFEDTDVKSIYNVLKTFELEEK